MRAYGLAVYGGFLAVFTYFIGWVEDLGVPRTIEEGPAGPTALAVTVDLMLLSLFGVQHSVMARPWFKRLWTRVVPAPVERTTYVLLSTATLLLVMWLWRPLPEAVWDVELTGLRAVGYTVSFAGWALVLLSTFAIDHADMFGLSQVRRHHAGQPPEAPALATPVLYRVVRHPLYLGFLVAFWAAPTMSLGRLLFAAVMTGYVLVGVRLEERDLVGAFGDDYHAYRSRTPMLTPRLVPRPPKRTPATRTEPT
jgi:protein-S-isoprenylcysteine O-methyltransferase Ste14